MTAGMADVIAAHYMDRDIYICDCGWAWTEHAGNAGSPLIHAAHVAEELAKAGYGNVQEAKAEAWENGKLSYFETTLTGRPICANPYLVAVEPQHG